MCVWCWVRETDDLKVSIAGPLSHIPQVMMWIVLLAVGNGGDVSLPSFLVLYISGHYWVDVCRGAITVRPQP